MEITAEAVGAVQGSRLLADLGEEEARAVAALLRPFSAAPQEELFRMRQPVERLFLLRSGTVHLGDPVRAVAGPDDTLGELALNGRTAHTATATAMTPVDGFSLDMADVERLRSRAHPLAFALLRRLSRLLAARIRAADDDDAPRADGRQPTVRPGPAVTDELPFLASLPVFERFDPRALELLGGSLRTWDLEPGGLLFSEGADARSAFIVLTGAIEVLRERGERRLRLATVGPGRMLGELSLVDGGARTATCRALDVTRVVEIDEDIVARLLDGSSPGALGFIEAVNRALIAALHATNARRVSMGAGWAEAPDGTGRRDVPRLIEKIRASVIGDDAVLHGPFGMRRNVYADYTASGRALTFIEDFVRDEVLPLYANTHTESSSTGLQTTRLREDARRLVHRSVGGSEEDVVVFCGSGATSAIDRLSQVLGLRISSELEDRFHLSRAITDDERPVVFVGPYEHHSNELPWRESVADVVTVLADADGRVDLTHLEYELRRYAHRPLKLGSFSAASNVTGIVTDVDAVAILLHRYGALSCWDYAAAGPYLPIDMNPSPDVAHGHLAYKDAVFLSPHKFIGGPGTPGVLIAKRSLFRNRVPSMPGGGTVLFVSPTRQSYDPEPTVREEAGTPAIIGSIRAGLAFALKDAVGADEIRRREDAFVQRALASWRGNPNIEILGSRDIERLAIVSLGVRHHDRLLHSNFVAALLNDLFGIQARSGCFCAGPYVHRIYGIDELWSKRMEEEAVLGRSGARLGFVRLNFNYFTSQTVFDYILDVMHFVADEGWKLLTLYRFDPVTGLWHHRSGRLEAPLTLDAVSFDSGVLEFRGPRATEPESALRGYLDEARRIVSQIETAPPDLAEPEPAIRPEVERIRWFTLPSEALAELQTGASA